MPNELENQDQDQNQNSPMIEEQNTGQQEGSQEAPSIDIEKIKQEAAREVAALYISSLGQKDRELQELKSQFETFKRTPPSTPEPEIDGAQFLESPNRHIRNIIQQEMATQIQPVQQILNQYVQDRQVTQIKSQLLAIPQYKEILDVYGDVVDTLVGANPTPQNYQSAILMIPGLVQTGQIPARNGSSKPSIPSKPSTSTPPSIPPSPPPAPRKPTGSTELNISETERTIARRMGISPEDYVRLRDEDDNIDSWKKKEKK